MSESHAEMEKAIDLVERQVSCEEVNQAIQEHYADYVMKSQYSYEADIETLGGARFRQSFDSTECPCPQDGKALNWSQKGLELLGLL